MKDSLVFVLKMVNVLYSWKSCIHVVQFHVHVAGLVSILFRINTAIKVFRYNIICIVFAFCVCHQPYNELCLALHVATAMPLNNLRVHALRMIKLSGLMLVFTVAGTTFLV